MELKTFANELDKRHSISTASEPEKINYLKIESELLYIRLMEIENVLEAAEKDIIQMLNLLAAYKWGETPRRIVYAQPLDLQMEKAKLRQEGFRIAARKFLGVNSRYTCASFTWSVKNTRSKERYQYYAVTLNLYWATHYHKFVDFEYSVESAKGIAKVGSYNLMQELLLSAYTNGPAMHWE